MSDGGRTGDGPTRHRSGHHVAVVGGGITGLAAAHRLLSANDPPRVTVLEASHDLGGKIRTTPFAGRPAVDEGADAFLARVPWAVELAREVGLGDQLVSPATGHAAVWFDGLHPIPDGLLLGLPTGLGSLARTRLLTWRGKARAALEPLLPWTDLGADSLGSYVRARFGDEVHERLVDPLVGSIYATDTDRFSLAAVPQVAALAAAHRSVLVGGRRRGRVGAPAGPVFYAPSSGLGALVDATASAVRRLGGEIVTGAEVEAIERADMGWRLHARGMDARGMDVDAVVLAAPAVAAAGLLAAGLAGLAELADVARDLAAVEYADVAIVTIALAPGALPRGLHDRSGYLVPKPAQHLVTAVSFGSQKWGHWAGADGSAILRISLGRDGLPVLHLDDAAIAATALDEVGRHLGVELQPTEVRVSRWRRAFPQYRPHHATRIADIEGRLTAGAPGIALAGASYHGIGVPACIRSGQEAADALLRRFDDGMRH